ncbi:MAG: metalloprotease PmbA [Gammaproteobacteria bacterium]|nr:metalloprotease PmbA [Gammaproteobacteria bacterium]
MKDSEENTTGVNAGLSDAVQLALEEAGGRGASSSEAAASLSQGLSVNVRKSEIETVEHTRDRNLVVSVYFGQRTGSASTSDYSPAAVKETVLAACNIAKWTEEDRCIGLADPERLAKDVMDLDLYHPWTPSVEEASSLALECEASALGADARIVNSEGASVDAHQGVEVYGNSLGFIGHTQKSRQGISCSVIAGVGDSMQRDYWYSSARRLGDLDTPLQVGDQAARRTLRRLGARRVPTCKVPVIYEAPVASSLLGHFISAISGGALYRKASFLLDHLDKKIFPEFVRIHEQPLIVGGMGSAAFDGEGVATSARDIVSDGILRGYVLGSYSARRLDMQTTGNAGGVHNLTIDAGDQNLEQMISGIDEGFLVTELIGFGINNVTGDYSRGAAGLWIENGEIAYPVEEVTVAGNLKDIFQNIAAIGNDVDPRRSTRCGSILVEGLTIAGD